MRPRRPSSAALPLLLVLALAAACGDATGPDSSGGDPSALGVVGQGSMQDRFTSDLWVHGGVAYTGTWGVRARADGPGLPGNRLYAWDVSDPAEPVLADSVLVDATTVNDIKVREDGTLAVLTHEASEDGLDGITLLDLSDPLHPEVITRFTETLEARGVHNVWIDGDYVYAVVNGVSPAAGLRVIDISDPAAPQVVASFYAGSSFLHDVLVRDGLAFLSHWDAGLVILDVGHGVAGGTPEAPVEVGRVQTAGGQTHNAWYWPERGYVFVGEEDFGFGSGERGILHVVDVRDLGDPIEVASYRVDGYTPHNFWLDEDREILYAAWYGAGIRAIDVSGELEGQLETQGREVASNLYAGQGGAPTCQGASAASSCAWAPQLHDGRLYLADMNTGLWVLEPVR